MANISTEINSILNDQSGESVRDSLVSALTKINAETTPIVTDADNGKILIVSGEGVWFASKLLQSIEITSLPIKTEYEYYETFDSTGLVVSATYLNGSTLDVTEQCTISMPDGEFFPWAQVGTTVEIFVSYLLDEVLKTASFFVDVKSIVKPQELIILTYPNKLVYRDKEPFDQAGLTARVVYNNGDTKDLTLSELTVSPRQEQPVRGTDENNDFSIIAQYTEKNERTSYYARKTIKGHVFACIGLVITSLPTKMNYIKGDPMDYTGMVLKAYYEDGTSRDVTNNLEDFIVREPEQGERVIASAVVLIYAENRYSEYVYRKEFNVNVYEFGFKIEQKPTKTRYDSESGYVLDFTGIQVAFVDENANKTDVWEDCTTNYEQGYEFDPPATPDDRHYVKIEVYYEYNNVTYSDYFLVWVTT